VVEQETFRNGAIVELIVIAMRGHLRPVSPLERVSLEPKVPLPNPTARVEIDPVVNRWESLDQLPGVGFAGGGETSPAPPLRLPYRSALAFPARASIAEPNGIGFVERMPSYAVSLRLATGCDGISPENILSRSDRLQVPRVHAGWISAQVVQVQTGRDRAAIALVVGAVRVLHQASNADASVAS
jgi:hypothetical protein